MQTNAGRPPGPVPRVMEINVLSIEAARALEFGGELGVERARRHIRAVIRHAVAVERQLSPQTDRAA